MVVETRILPAGVPTVISHSDVISQTDSHVSIIL